MRNAMLAILALFAGGTAVIAGSAPAAAEIDYPWCVKGGASVGASGDCSYSTLEQCQASASGRWNLYCNINIASQVQRGRQRGVVSTEARPPGLLKSVCRLPAFAATPRSFILPIAIVERP